MIERRPIRSPIQKKDLEKKSRPDDSWVSIDNVRALEASMNELHSRLSSTVSDAEETLAHLQQLRQGSQGEQGPKGDSVFTEADLIPYIEWMVEHIKTFIPAPVKGDRGDDGDNGDTPVLGLHYFTKEDQAKMVNTIMAKIRQPKDGETPVVDHSQIASVVIGKILKDKLLTKDHIGGLTEEIASYRSQMAKGAGYVHGGGDTVTQGSGITITPTSDGRKVISATGSGGTTIKTPSGLVNATNATYGVTGEPVFVIADGITYFEGFGYAYDSGTNTVTLTIPPSQYIRYGI